MDSYVTGGLLGLASQLKATTSPHTVGWSVPACNKSAHVAIVLDPAKTP
jgi:hypothetical protein